MNTQIMLEDSFGLFDMPTYSSKITSVISLPCPSPSRGRDWRIFRGLLQWLLISVVIVYVIMAIPSKRAATVIGSGIQCDIESIVLCPWSRPQVMAKITKRASHRGKNERGVGHSCSTQSDRLELLPTHLDLFLLTSGESKAISQCFGFEQENSSVPRDWMIVGNILVHSLRLAC